MALAACASLAPYGAQRGLFLIQGDADARAGIRLSGADMVLGVMPSTVLRQVYVDAKA